MEPCKCAKAMFGRVAVIITTVGNNDISRVTTLTTRVIAVNTPNINTTNSDWTKYIVTVKDIETATGYNLLSNLYRLSVQDCYWKSKKRFRTLAPGPLKGELKNKKRP